MRLDNDEVVIDTPNGPPRIDRPIVGTGYRIDLGLRPEPAHFAADIAAWRDRSINPRARSMTCSAAIPSSAKRSGPPSASRAARRCFTTSGTSISGTRHGVERLVSGSSRDPFVEDAQPHLDDLPRHDAIERVSLDPPDGR